MYQESLLAYLRCFPGEPLPLMTVVRRVREQVAPELKGHYRERLAMEKLVLQDLGQLIREKKVTRTQRPNRVRINQAYV